MRALNKFRQWYVKEYNNAYGGDKAGIIICTCLILVLLLFVFLGILTTPVLWIPTIVIVSLVWGFFTWVFKQEEDN
jgi:hypothetical protein